MMGAGGFIKNPGWEILSSDDLANDLDDVVDVRNIINTFFIDEINEWDINSDFILQPPSDDDEVDEEDLGKHHAFYQFRFIFSIISDDDYFPEDSFDSLDEDLEDELDDDDNDYDCDLDDSDARMDEEESGESSSSSSDDSVPDLI